MVQLTCIISGFRHALRHNKTDILFKAALNQRHKNGLSVHAYNEVLLICFNFAFINFIYHNPNVLLTAVTRCRKYFRKTPNFIPTHTLYIPYRHAPLSVIKPSREVMSYSKRKHRDTRETQHQSQPARKRRPIAAWLHGYMAFKTNKVYKYEINGETI